MIFKEFKSPKEYLSQIGMYESFIAQKEAEKERYKKLSKNISSDDYQKEMKELEHEVDEEIIEYARTLHRITNEIQSLANKKHSDILYSVYVDMKSLAEISVDKSYTYEYVKSLHGYALAEFGNKILKRNNK